MRSFPAVVVTLLASILVVTACGGGQNGTPGQPSASPTPTATPTATASPTEASPSPSPSGPSPTAAAVFALHRYAAAMPATWREPVVLPYGTNEDQLGTSLGGEGLQWGPAYGTVAGDGSWWILDAAKTRFAHYDAAGTYLDQVVIPEEYLVQGRYVQWQRPVALDDGTVVTFRMATETTSFLLLRDGVFRQVDVDRHVTVHADDGRLLYGFGADGELLAVDLEQGTATEVEAFRSRTGVPYRLVRDGSSLHLTLPDSSVDRMWPQIAAETGGPAAGAISLATTANGRFHVFVDGAAEADEGTGRSGYGVIDPHGDLTATEPTREPWSPSDDGSGSRLIARPGSNDVWFIAIDTDAVRLYQRSDAPGDG